MPPFDPQQWLLANAPGYGELAVAERQAIADFSLLWSLFEAQALNTSASAGAIVEACTRWHGETPIQEAMLFRSLAYFRHRYLDVGKTNHLFENLHFRRKDQRALVETVLFGTSKNQPDVLAGLLIIVFRYRNNFFHGIKWAYGFRDQLGNFEESNKLLTSVLELRGYGRIAA